MSQSNIQKGRIVLAAAVDLTGMADRLVRIAPNGSTGAPEFDLPAANTDLAVYVLTDEAIAAKHATADPISAHINVRIVAKSTGSAGDVLVLADVGTAADKGKVRTLPATAGVYLQVGIAEEAFVDGQLTLMRPCVKLVYVKSTDTLTALTFTGGGATGAEVGALRNALKTILEAQGLMA